MCSMDAVKNLEKIFKLILENDLRKFEENERSKGLQLDRIKISENVNTDDCSGKQLEKVLTSTELVLKLFLNNYETNFNVFIEYIFGEVYSIFHYAVFNRTLSTFPVDNLLSVINLILEIAIYYPCDPNTKKLTNFYKWNINEIKLKQDRECDSASSKIDELVLHLRVISIVYEALNNSRNEMHRARHIEQLRASIIGEYCESEIFVKLVCGNSEVLMMQTLLDIIPKFIAFTRCYRVLELLWEEICILFKMGTEVEISKIFTILCYLSDSYFVVSHKQLMTKVFTECIFWNLIQNGLTHSDCTVRKQALFLTRTSLNYIIQNNINFYCYKKEVENLEEGEGHTTILPFIYWEHGMKFDELKELCIIVEYLEENQTHIVKPILNIVDNCLGNIHKQKLDLSWILVIIQKMLSHDNIKIVRQGLTNLMKISVNYYYEKSIMRKMMKLLIGSLNCTKVYMTDLPVLLEEMKTYFENCTKHGNGKIFYRLLIQEMCSVQWSSEALYAITYSLQSIKSKKYWCTDELNLIRKLLINGTANHYTYIKSGMQCQLLLAAINLIDTCSVSLEDIDNFLNCYSGKILQRKTALWESVVKWIRNFYNVEEAQHFIRKTLGKKNIGRMIVLLYDSYADDEKFLNNIKLSLKNISVPFVGIHARPYCDKHIQNYNLSIICDIIRESLGSNEFWNIFSPFLSDIVLYIKLQLESVHHIKDFQSCKILTKHLNTILSCGLQHSVLSDMLIKWFNEIVEDLVQNNDSDKMFPVKEYVKITLVNMLMDHTLCETSLIASYLQAHINSSLVKTSDNLMTKDLQTLWGRMNSEFARTKWEILSKIRMLPSKILRVSNFQFVSCCLEALDLNGYNVLLPLTCAIGKELPSLVDEPACEELVDAIWRAIVERKKNEEYLSLIKEFVEAIYQIQVIQNKNDNIRRMLVNYSLQLLSGNTTGPASELVQRMQEIGFNEKGLYLYEVVLPRSLIYGQMLKKDERLIRELCSMIESSALSPLPSDFRSSNEVRARSVQMILTLDPTNEVHCQFSEKLFESLTELEESCSKNKTRYFSDSHVHRVKQRLLQAMLILEPYLAKGVSEKLWDWLSKKILLENNQLSVRYLQEWIMVRIIHRYPRFRDAVWTYFDEGLEKRTGSLCSFISIIYHSLKCIPREEVADWIERAVITFLPHCMAQHFSVRLYAQVTLEKLLATAENQHLKTISEKYAAVKQSLSLSIDRGNAIKNCAKMRDDFYFTVFHPVKHYSLRTIFFELPRLSNLNAEELIPDSLFAKCGVNVNKYVIPFTNADDTLEKCAASKWTSGGSNEDSFMGDSCEKGEPGLLNFQKKIIPVKYLTPDHEELFDGISFSSKNMPKDGLVVVASLIDRLPNLGGLSRTCEVFGACELVIGSLKYVEDKQFRSLSVTAEKWITITEVKPFNLSDYLIKMKRSGYAVLAAEQTVNSQPLQSVRFPKKSLLLLGNEKEGIPPTLLPLMDICIEIPQIGVIRSLNVHVTGALFVWEYAKQHHFGTECNSSTVAAF